MKKFYGLFTIVLLVIALSVPAFAAKDILTSIHGSQIGLDSNGDLIVKGEQITDVTASAGATATVNTTESLTTGGVRSVTLTMAAVELAITESTTASVFYGGVKVYDFPEGMLLFLGAVIDGSLTTTSATATPLYDGDVSLGTITADSTNTLTSTEADLLISNALTQAVAYVANCDAQPSATQITESGALWSDGTAAAKDMYLNFLIDEDAGNATGSGTFTGTVEFTYIMLGDN